MSSRTALERKLDKRAKKELKRQTYEIRVKDSLTFELIKTK